MALLALAMEKIIEKELSYKLGGIFFRAQKKLGRFCREKQYADALENAFLEEGISFRREYPIILEHKKSNFVDFFVENKIFTDLKAKAFIEKDDYYQMKRYLEIENVKLGLIVNFRQGYLQPKRVLNSKFSQHSHQFAVSHRSKAFTLVELLVAMGIFVIVISIAATSFIQALRTQQSIVALMEANDNISLVLEQMAREIRTGYRFCTASAPILNLDPIYTEHCNDLTANELAFVNALEREVSYRLEDEAIWERTGVLGIPKDGKITADNVKINYFNIVLTGNDADDNLQSRITISLSISPTGRDIKDVKTNIQTTISPRPPIINP